MIERVRRLQRVRGRGVLVERVRRHDGLVDVVRRSPELVLALGVERTLRG